MNTYYGTLKQFTVTVVLMLLASCVGTASLFAQNDVNQTNSISAIDQKLQSIDETEEVLLSVSIQQPVTSQELLVLLSESTMQIHYVTSHWGEHTGWYVFDENQALSDGLKDFANGTKSFFDNKIEQLQTEIASSTAVSSAASDANQDVHTKEELLSSIQEGVGIFNRSGVLISKIVFKGKPAQLRQGIQSVDLFSNTEINVEVNGLKRLSSTEVGAAEAQQIGVVQAGAPYPNEPWKFTPQKGTVYYTSSSKRIGSNFSWSDKSGFDSTHRAYEHDLTIWSQKDVYVRVGGSGPYYSNLPAAYLDTTFLDSNAIFTIGSNWGEGIQLNTGYYTELPVQVIDSNKGPSSGDVTSQLSSWAGTYDDGESPPEWQESSFCTVYGWGTDPANCIFSDQSFPIGNPTSQSTFYYDSANAYRDFPFNHNNSFTYNWKQGYGENALSCPSSQYKAKYYNTVTNNLIFMRCEGWPINQNWGNGGPGNGIGNDNFSVQWTGTAYFSSGRYTFISNSDDGIRVWLDNVLIIDAWRDQGPTEYRHTRDVSAGNHSIKVEYYEHGGGAIAQFRWEQVQSNTNIALNKPAYAWSQQSSSYAPNKGNDGNNSTRWSSTVSSSLGGQWWWIDLGSRQNVNQVIIRWEAAYAKSYAVGWSDDGNNFSGLWYTLSAPGSYAHNIGNRQGRYIGVYMAQRAPTMNNYSFWEYEAYNRSSIVASTSSEDGQQTDMSNLDAELLMPESEALVELVMGDQPISPEELKSLYLPSINR